MARAAAAEAPVRARCEGCGTGLSYQAWERGESLCRLCRQVEAGPAATFLPMPRTGARAYVQPKKRETPDELIDELIARLEADAAAAPLADNRPDSVGAVLRDIGFGQSERELPWAVWGFALGFTLNVVVAKYAQMTSGAAMSEFIPAFIFGGIVAGAAGAGIGWAVAKLKER